MTSALGQVENLVIGPDSGGDPVVAQVSFQVRPGEVLGVVGRSGSGKSTAVLSLLGHVRAGLHRRGGTVTVAGHDVWSAAGARRIRGRVVSYLGQDPASALNPARRIGAQIAEAVRLRTPGADVRAEVAALLTALRLPADRGFQRRYPHQVSGGQAQRVAFAAALAGDPALLVLDEPTAGLDTVLAAEVRALIPELLRAGRPADRGAVLVSHDRHLISAVADRVLVFTAGRCVEADPASLTRRARPDLPRPRTAGEPVLRAEALTAGYGRAVAFSAVDAAVAAGECLAVVGPSGSGKSTLARVLVGLHPYWSGRLSLAGEPLAAYARRRRPAQRPAIQLVAQDSLGALNPRETVAAALTRPMRTVRGLDRARIAAEISRLLDRVHLPVALADRRPGELSGGERQRVNLARALACDPRVLVCDEVTSALDHEIADAVLDLLDELRQTLGLAVVVITHDLAAVARRADRVMVLEHGRVIETGPTGALLAAPQHPVTRLLVDASPDMAPAPAGTD